jgi:hypothetical protein
MTALPPYISRVQNCGHEREYCRITYQAHETRTIPNIQIKFQVYQIRPL